MSETSQDLNPKNRLSKGKVLSLWESEYHRWEVRAGRWRSADGSHRDCLVVCQTRLFSEGREGKTFTLAIEEDFLPALLQGIETWQGYLDNLPLMDECFV